MLLIHTMLHKHMYIHIHPPTHTHTTHISNHLTLNRYETYAERTTHHSGYRSC